MQGRAPLHGEAQSVRLADTGRRKRPPATPHRSRPYAIGGALQKNLPLTGKPCPYYTRASKKIGISAILRYCIFTLPLWRPFYLRL